jgi:hypothetical protein
MTDYLSKVVFKSKINIFYKKTGKYRTGLKVQIQEIPLGSLTALNHLKDS